ncbi:MAG: RNA polymerase sigma factor [bacterium]
MKGTLPLTLVEEKSTVDREARQASLFEEIVLQYRRPLVALAFRMLNNLEDARDQAQEAFIRFWKMKSWPPEAEEVVAVLNRITVNLCIDKLRKLRRFRLFQSGAQAVISQHASSDNADRAVLEREMTILIQAAVARLKPRQKAVFVLRDVEGYSVRETAQILSCAENNVLVNLHLARKNLKKWLTPYLKE